jgi:hypothetical protein
MNSEERKRIDREKKVEEKDADHLPNDVACACCYMRLMTVVRGYIYGAFLSTLTWAMSLF